MTEIKRVAVAYGDGIGPEIMEATIKILKEAGARISFEAIEVGKLMYERGFKSGIPDEAWKTIHENKILLKSPITTPQGGGYKSLNVTMRKTLGLYSNVRPCRSYPPFVSTQHPNLDIVIVRENEEDLYSGIEYRQTEDSYHTIKLITRSGCERIIRYAFEYAVKNNRKKVTCFSKDNIMKFSDGIFHKVFNEISQEYPNIATDHYIVDIGTARLASKPGIFDVIVTSNLYGDIISDVVAEVSGSVGLAGSANIGNDYAMFEAIHGSAPDIAGQNIANPSGLIQAAIMMLIHINQNDVAEKIQNAWLKTIEDGIHTIDIKSEQYTKKQVGTIEFANAVIERLNKVPTTMKKAEYPAITEQPQLQKNKTYQNEQKDLVGVDIYIDLQTDNQDKIAEKINTLTDKIDLGLQMISYKGLKVWPRESGQSLVGSDLWSLRFVPKNSSKITSHKEIISLLSILSENGFDCIKTENLYVFDNKNLGFSMPQGE